MLRDELNLNIKNVRFETLVSQLDVISEEEAEELREQGYYSVYTVDEFRDKLPGIDPAHVYYYPSVSGGSIYFNKETMAVVNLRVEMVMLGFLDPESVVKKYISIIEKQEEAVKNGNYIHSILCLPEAMCIQYMDLLVQKKGESIPNLYQLYLDVYQYSSYGFDSIKAENIEKVVQSKTEEEKQTTIQRLKDFPDILTIYRGENSKSTPTEKAYSWTVDIGQAYFFATAMSHGGEARIITGTVNKADVIEFISDSKEKEIIVRPQDVKVEQVVPLLETNDLPEVSASNLALYNKYFDMIGKLEFAQESLIHGRAHTARVLYLALLIAEELHLSDDERETLAIAAAYHDTWRKNDGIDPEHGRRSRLFYEETNTPANPEVSFLIEYHCRPDEEGYSEISQNKQLDEQRMTKLYQVFKDADGLDRVRFGCSDLDVNQLRIEESKKMIPLAQTLLSRIRI